MKAAKIVHIQGGQEMKSETRELLSMEIKGLSPTVNMMYRGIHGHRFKTSDTVEYQIIRSRSTA